MMIIIIIIDNDNKRQQGHVIPLAAGSGAGCPLARLGIIQNLELLQPIGRHPPTPSIVPTAKPPSTIYDAAFAMQHP